MAPRFLENLQFPDLRFYQMTRIWCIK